MAKIDPQLESLESCRKLGRFLLADYISFEEYAYSVTLKIVSASLDQIPIFMELIPLSFLQKYKEYVRTYLEESNFRPSPMHFLARPASEQEIKNKEEELRPRYIRLYDCRRIRGLRSASG